MPKAPGLIAWLITIVWFTPILWFTSGAVLAASTSQLMLPVEVVGADGATVAVSVDAPAGQASTVRALWMQIHNLAYADMASVQINGNAWMALNNDTSAVAEPGELEQEFQLEGRGREFHGATGETRTWFNTVALNAAPAEANILDGPNGMGGKRVYQ